MRPLGEKYKTLIIAQLLRLSARLKIILTAPHADVFLVPSVFV